MSYIDEDLISGLLTSIFFCLQHCRSRTVRNFSDFVRVYFTFLCFSVSFLQIAKSNPLFTVESWEVTSVFSFHVPVSVSGTTISHEYLKPYAIYHGLHFTSLPGRQNKLIIYRSNMCILWVLSIAFELDPQTWHLGAIRQTKLPSSGSIIGRHGMISIL